jgi:hypothetical protein
MRRKGGPSLLDDENLIISNNADAAVELDHQ